MSKFQDDLAIISQPLPRGVRRDWTELSTRVVTEMEIDLAADTVVKIEIPDMPSRNFVRHLVIGGNVGHLFFRKAPRLVKIKLPTSIGDAYDGARANAIEIMGSMGYELTAAGWVDADGNRIIATA